MYYIKRNNIIGDTINRKVFEEMCLNKKLNPFKVSLRLSHKIRQKSEKEDVKLAKDVLNYLDNTPEYYNIKDKLPKSLLRKYKTPESMYLINKNTAKSISKTLKKHISADSPVVEVNPGLGFLSEELLQNWSNHIHMFETSSHFSQHINVSKST